jgi:outer membrane protein TolC
MIRTASFLVLALAVPGAARARGRLVTLDAALERAREANERFQLADEELRRARLARDRAWAALLPTLRASGSFTHSDREITRDFGGESVVFLKQDAFAGSVNAQVTLFKGTAVPELMRAYRLAAAAEQTHRWNRATLEFEVARAYLAALSAKNLVSAAERTLKSADEHLEAARARRQAGEALAIDVTRARIERVQARGELTRARNALEGSTDYLAFLLGRRPPIAVERPRLPATAKKLAGDPMQRPDVKASALRAEAAQKAVTGSWLDYLPSLGAVWNYEATQNTGFSGDPDSWRLIFTLDWVLFDGGLRRAARHEQASLLREARLRQRLLRREVRHLVRQARRDLGTAQVNLETAREQLQLAQKNRELVLSRYRAGLGTSLELVEADDALRKAEVAVIGGELELALRGLELCRTLGLDPRGRTIGG